MLGRFRLRFQMVGANPAPTASSLEPIPGNRSIYVGGTDGPRRFDSRWFRAARLTGVYPGIDVPWSAETVSERWFDGSALFWQATVRPGADPSAIRFRFTGTGTRPESNDESL